MQIRQAMFATFVSLPLAIGAAAVQAEVDIAVVDVQAAVVNSEEAKRLLLQIDTEFKSEEDKLRVIQSEIAALLERMQKNAEVMNDSEKRRVQQQIESKRNDLAYNGQKLQAAVEERRAELFAGIDAKVQKALGNLIKTENYDVIVQRQAALFVGDLYDATRKLTEQLNQVSAGG